VLRVFRVIWDLKVTWVLRVSKVIWELKAI
jgi:hypothetical protein